MTVTVIIERRIKPSQEKQALDILWEMLSSARSQRSYQTSDTLLEHSDARHWFVLSTWDTVEDWEAWQVSTIRQGFEARLEPHLDSETKVAMLTSLPAWREGVPG